MIKRLKVREQLGPKTAFDLVTIFLNCQLDNIELHFYSEVHCMYERISQGFSNQIYMTRKSDKVQHRTQTYCNWSLEKLSLCLNTKCV